MDLKVVKKLNSEVKNNLKSCSDCSTTKTPLWRGGPAGPKSLCNACGIKFHKKRRQLLGLAPEKNAKKKKKRSSVVNRSNEIRDILKLVLLNGDVLRQSGKLMGELREEERAAIVLMALSCGSVYA
ncbi:hypothetical protein CASFOL_002590 [Castilleja foliolosa]|uniref:GATA-type domain-containing protein n=1 Tax=Castilleja foliolosa TaxID=1961234 RepID=A0ABD3EIP0_9LAMI